MPIGDIIFIGLMVLVILDGIYTMIKMHFELRRMTEDPYYRAMLGLPRRTKDDVIH